MDLVNEKLKLKSLLWKSSGNSALAVAAIGAFAGLILVLLSFQVGLDMRYLIQKEGEGSYIVINKKMNLVKSALSLIGGSNHFSEEEINELKDQSFAEDAATFLSNEFRVSVSSSTLGFYSELFLQAVDQRFLDVESDEFKWEVGDRVVPIIVSKDYLALYNFGFAPSQGLPQFTESTIQRVSLNLNISGKGLTDRFSTKIVGFSKRINSVLVPVSFIEYANGKFGKQRKGSSQLILKTVPGQEKELDTYLEENDYETARNGFLSGSSQIVQLLIGLIIGLGLLLLILAVLVFALSFRLMVEESAAEIKLMHQLGYDPEWIIKEMSSRLGKGFLVLAMLVLGVFLVFKAIYSLWLTQKGLELTYFPSLFTIILAVLLFGLFYWKIQREIRQRIVKLLV